MTHNPLIIAPALTVLMAITGLAFGLVYFATLKRSVTLFATGRGWLGPLMITAGRIGPAVAFIFVAAKLGAAPLLAAFVGFLQARSITRQAARAPTHF